MHAHVCVFKCVLGQCDRNWVLLSSKKEKRKIDKQAEKRDGKEKEKRGTGREEKREE